MCTFLRIIENDNEGRIYSRQIELAKILCSILKGKQHQYQRSICKAVNETHPTKPIDVLSTITNFLADDGQGTHKFFISPHKKSSRTPQANSINKFGYFAKLWTKKKAVGMSPPTNKIPIIWKFGC